ncbi:MAG: hypothetical protein L3J93_00355 [Thermoplasmata archaeon]|nr:hypothetical protein [Thermoplasmata archaeon]
MYNLVREGHALTLVEASQFPEKFASLLTAVAMADRILLVVPALTRDIGEIAATVDVVDCPTEILLGAGVGEAEVRRAFRGTRLAEAPTQALDLTKLRAEAEGWESVRVEGPVAVSIDHAFPVKGVGAVALGVVRSGVLKAHDRLRLFPTEKSVEVRSVQVHDVDVPSAACGERVGVALKGVDADEVSRGHILAPEGSLAVAQSFAARITCRCPFYKGRLAEGAQLHLQAGLQIVPASVLKVDGDALTLEADRPVALPRSGVGTISDLSAGPGPRIVGRVDLRADGNVQAPSAGT